MSDSKYGKIRILLVGGGTGGHFYPLISIAEALNQESGRPTIYYAGPEPYDTPALALQNISFISIAAGKQRKYFSILNFFDIFRTFFGTWIAFFKIFILYPDVVMSKGGYTSVPVVLAAVFLRIPIVIHESDSKMGRANKLASHFAQHIITAYDNVVPHTTHASIHKFGIPIRETLRLPSNAEVKTRLGVTSDRPVLLILGGSQGAERINALILDSLDELLTDFTIIHQTGEAGFTLCSASADTLIPDPERRKHYYPISFLEGPLLNEAYHLSRIVISRAGSNSIYEIALHQKPSILIPIPEDISHDQRSNAYSYARGGGAVVLEEENLSDALLKSEINRIMQNDDIYASMSTGARSFATADAHTHIASILMSIATKHIS